MKKESVAIGIIAVAVCIVSLAITCFFLLSPGQKSSSAMGITGFSGGRTAEPVLMEIACPEPTATPIPLEATPVPPKATPVPMQTEAPLGEGNDASHRAIFFTESKELPLPSEREALPKGRPFHLDGSITSDSPLTMVSLVISGDSGIVDEQSVMFSPVDNVLAYRLTENAQTDGNRSLNDLVKFSSLETGEYVLKLMARSRDIPDGETVAQSAFQVRSYDWVPLISNNFRSNYLEALAFFQGDTERFLFTYKWAEGRHITTDPQWVEKYITSMEGFGGKSWGVHVDAKPYFEKALEYLDNTYLRVHCGKKDSGVIQLSELIREQNGTYVSRFVSDRTFVSHHALGTAIDINAGIAPYHNDIANREILKREVGEHLTYNGIQEEKGKRYYDFTYSGEYEPKYDGVPAPLLNYLLFELAFYRAGFGWGYYYQHTCDAMHFTLSEFQSSVHRAENGGLGKVTEYID